MAVRSAESLWRTVRKTVDETVWRGVRRNREEAVDRVVERVRRMLVSTADPLRIETPRNGR